ncbi:MAG: helicase C-terminal domain-containing protein [Planctomycetota bacterium]
MRETIVAVDIETTGLDAYEDEIIEAAAAVYKGGEIVGRFAERIRPIRPLSAGIIKLTGLTPAALKDARGADAVLADLLDFLPGDATFVAHNARFVRSFLRRATKDRFGTDLLDTAELSRICLPALPSHRLDALREELGLPRSEAGGALGDCETILAVLEKLVDAALDIPLPVLIEINRLFRRARSQPLREFFRAALGQVRGRQGGRPPRFVSLFREEPLPKSRRTVPDPSEYEALDASRFEELLGPDGPFAERLTGYEHRTEQIAMAWAVTEALNGSQHLLVEAGTGIGKSLAYLVPAVHWASQNKTPVVVSTNTKNLQSQLFFKDLPLIREALDVEFTTALIKGRRNYLCLRKLLYLLRHAGHELPRADRARLAGLLVWAASTESGDISESGLGAGAGSRRLAEQITSLGEECRGYQCEHSRRCFLYRARRRARSADVIVANHAVLFAEMAMPDQSVVLPPYQQVIFDEAHNLEAAATRHFSIEVSLPLFRRVLRRLWRPGRRRTGSGLIPTILREAERIDRTSELWDQVAGQATKAIDGLSKMDAALEPFFERLAALLGKKDDGGVRRIWPDRKRESLWAPIRSAKERLISGLSRVMRPTEGLAETLAEMDPVELRDQADFIQQLSAVVDWLRELTHDLELFLATANENYVYWVERVAERRGGVRGWAAPIRVGPELFEHVYGPKQTAVFTSATLTVRGSTAFLRKRLGLDLVEPDRLIEMNAGTPFDYERQCRVMVPTFLPEPSGRGTEYGEKLGVLLAEVFRRTRGRAMALFTSYHMLRATTAVLRDELLGDGIQILAQGASGSRESITDVFKRDVRSVLMGTHSFWEGVDLMGETLSCLVVARLPFAVYTDPIHQARCEQVEAEGENAFIGYSLPSAVIRLRQGFGRLIRHKTDRGIVIIADRRIVTRRYGAWFRESLPAPTQTFGERDEFLDEIEEFVGEP